jgi:hypothetical protein
MRYLVGVHVLAEFADQAGVLLVPLLLLGTIVAVVMTGVAAVLSTQGRAVGVVYVALGILLATSSVWLVLYAAGPDSYYEPSHYSRWEHAGRFLGASPVVIGVIGAVATSILLIASAFSPARRVLRLAAAPAAALSCFLLVLGWFALTAGH